MEVDPPPLATIDEGATRALGTVQHSIITSSKAYHLTYVTYDTNDASARFDAEGQTRVARANQLHCKRCRSPEPSVKHQNFRGRGYDGMAPHSFGPPDGPQQVVDSRTARLHPGGDSMRRDSRKGNSRRGPYIEGLTQPPGFEYDEGGEVDFVTEHRWAQGRWTDAERVQPTVPGWWDRARDLLAGVNWVWDASLGRYVNQRKF